MATVNLGRIKPVFRGAYSGSTAYVVDDIVTHGNESFICIQAHGAGTQATSQGSYWTKLAAKGTDGTDVGTTITTQGDILYRDGSGLQRLAKPASDMYLKNTSGGVLSWAALSSDWVKILHTNITSDVGSLDMVHGTNGVVIDSTYRVYRVFGSYRGDTNGAEFTMRVANSGTFRSSSYLCEAFRTYYSGGTSRANATGKILRSIGGVQAATGQRGNFDAMFYNMSDADHNTTAFCNFNAIDGTGESENQVNVGICGGVYQTPEAHNGIQFGMSSGNIAEAEITLVGLKG